MPSYRDPETLLIRRQEDEAARQRRPPLQERWPSSPRAVSYGEISSRTRSPSVIRMW